MVRIKGWGRTKRPHLGVSARCSHRTEFFFWTKTTGRWSSFKAPQNAVPWVRCSDLKPLPEGGDQLLGRTLVFLQLFRVQCFLGGGLSYI